MSDTWIQTRSGQAVDLLDPKPSTIKIDDIAWSLSMLCRFTGHCDAFYSVAQHSVHVSEIVCEINPRLGLVGLLHDSDEAYLGDWSRPLKMAMREDCVDASHLAVRFQHAIGRALGVTLTPEPSLVKHADRVMLATEHRDLVTAPCARSWGQWPDPRPATIEPWPQRYAYERFLQAYGELAKG